MKKLALICFALTLTGCGTPLLPITQPFQPERVEFPGNIGATEPLTITVHYSVATCSERQHSLTLVARQPDRLELNASLKKSNGMFLACSTGVSQHQLTYVDSGSPARTDPFEIVINGKSWGKINIR